MMNIPLILAVVVGLAVVGLLIFFVVYRKNKQAIMSPDYRTFTIIGIVFLPIGLATKNPGLWIVGLVFLTVGLANKNKWEEPKPWSELPPHTRRLKIAIIVGLGLLFAISTVAYFLAR